MIFKNILLSIIQGITEFLPVSSSGHLVIFNNILSAEGDLFYYVILHLGTALAPYSHKNDSIQTVNHDTGHNSTSDIYEAGEISGLALIVFFFKDIIKITNDIETIKKIFIVTVITGFLGFLGKDFFEGLFSNYKFVITALFINGLILIISNNKINSFKKTKLNILDSIILGFTQGLAIIPGISRSGITISTLICRGVKKEEAFRFSFLAAIPIIFASFLFEIKNKDFNLPDLLLPKYIMGLIISFLVGYLSLLMLRFLIKKSRLDIFGYYCIMASCVLWIVEILLN